MNFSTQPLGIAKFFFDIIFKNQLRTQFTNMDDYSAFMGNYSIAMGVGTLLIALLSLLIGSWVLKNKGWFATLRISASVILSVGILAIASALFMDRQFFTISLGTSYQILLNGIATSLIYPLVQIVYLTIPSAVRFQAKVWTELVVVRALVMVSSFSIQELLMIFGTLSIPNVIQKLALVMVLYFIGRIGKQEGVATLKTQ